MVTTQLEKLHKKYNILRAAFGVSQFVLYEQLANLQPQRGGEYICRCEVPDNAATAGFCMALGSYMKYVVIFSNHSISTVVAIYTAAV